MKEVELLKSLPLSNNFSVDLICNSPYCLQYNSYNDDLNGDGKS